MNVSHKIAGVRVDFMQPERVLSIIRHNDSGPLRIVLVNPHTVMNCRRSPELHSALATSEVVLPDGVGISLAARLLRLGLFARTPGPNLMLYLCDHGRSHNLRHYFYGGKPGIAERLVERLLVQFPGIQIAGWDSPPFSDCDSPINPECCRMISSSRPDVVWVGLGSPKQEIWMARNVQLLKAKAVIGVGAAFDFHSGAIPRAPLVLRQIGLEWLYRLKKEPARMWRRNLDSPRFLLLALWEGSNSRTSQAPSQRNVGSSKGKRNE